MHWLDGHQVAWFGASVLAVDFFFMLSGLVIQISYYDKLKTQSDVRKFARKRVVRLYPLIIVSLCLGIFRLGMIALLEGPESIPDGYLQPHRVLAQFLTVPVSFSSGEGMFPLNVPLWSLHFEFLAYLLFAVLLAHVGKRSLVALGLLSAPGLVLWAAVGFGQNPAVTSVPDYAFGLSRVCFAFTVGVLLARFHLNGKLEGLTSGRSSRPALLTLPLAVFALPSFELPPAVVLVFIAVVFPTVIVLGLGVELSPRGERVAKIAGELSFPVYVLHLPIMWILNGGLKSVGFFENPVYNGFIVLPMIVVTSSAILRWFDEPVRSSLSKPRPLRRSGWLAG